MGPSRVIRVTNIAPQATRDQIQTLFQFVGKVEEIKLYPTVRDVAIPVTSRMSFVKFVEKDHVGISQHLNNTVFIDRALIITPFENPEIPDEHAAMQELVQSNGVLGITNEQQLPAHVSNVVDGAYYNTKDPTFAGHGVPEYPPLPCTLEYGQVEEIRRTVVVGNLAPDTDPQQLMDWMSEAGEVKFVRLCGRETDVTRACLIEFTEQSSVVPAVLRTGTMLNGRPLAVAHAAQAIAKPQIKTNELAMREIEEAMRRAQEQQSLISSTMVPQTNYMDESKRSKSRSRRSRSRSRGGRRHRSRSRARYRRSRSRSRRRSRSRKRSPGKRRSRSRDKKSSRRSRSRDRSRRHRSRSHDKKDKDKDKSRDKDKNRDKDKAKDKEKSSSDSKAQKEEEKPKADRKEEATVSKGSKSEGNARRSSPPRDSSKTKDVKDSRRSRSRSPAPKKRSRSRSRHRSRSPKRVSGRASRVSPPRRRSRTRSPARRRVPSPPRRRRSRTPPRRRSRSPVARKKSRSPRRGASPPRSSRSRRSQDRKADRGYDRDSKRESKSDRRDRDRKSDKAESKPPAPRDYDEEEKGFDEGSRGRSSSRDSSPKKSAKDEKGGGGDDMDISE